MKKTVLIILVLFLMMGGNVFAGDLEVTGKLKAQYLVPRQGTGDPYYYLRFSDGYTDWGGLMLNNSSTAYGDGNDVAIYTYGDRDLSFYTGTGNVLIFPASGGKVGIGTKTPQSLLDVDGTLTAINANVTNRLGVGTTAPSKTFHLVRGSSAGADPGFISNDAVLLESNTNLNLHFFTPDDKQAGIMWSNPTTRNRMSILYNQLSDNLTFYRGNDYVINIDENGWVGIGVFNPVSPLHVNGTIVAERDDSASVQLRAHHDEAWRGGFYTARRSRGTEAAPAAIGQWDSLIFLDAWGYDGNSYERAAQITAAADGTVSDGIISSEWKFNTTDSQGNFSTKMTIRGDGKVGIGTTAPQAILDVAGDEKVSGNVDVGGDTTVSGNATVSGVLMGAAKDTAGNPLKICTGKTDPSLWVIVSVCGMTQTIDTSSCGFTTTPMYFTSMGGNAGQSVGVGTSSIYEPTATSVRVVVYYEKWDCTSAPHVAQGWYINWVAIGQ